VQAVQARVNQQVASPHGQRCFVGFHLGDEMTVVSSGWPAKMICPKFKWSSNPCPVGVALLCIGLTRHLPAGS
jgi:hypothetical protein